MIEFSSLKGVHCTSYLELARFVCYLHIINTFPFSKINACIVKQVVKKKKKEKKKKKKRKRMKEKKRKNTTLKMALKFSKQSK